MLSHVFDVFEIANPATNEGSGGHPDLLCEGHENQARHGPVRSRTAHASGVWQATPRAYPSFTPRELVFTMTGKVSSISRSDA